MTLPGKVIRVTCSWGETAKGIRARTLRVHNGSFSGVASRIVMSTHTVNERFGHSELKDLLCTTA